MANHQISAEIRKNFHLFCDNFPFPVMLIHKDRTILAVNKTAEEEGYPTGIRCIELGEKEHHKGCLAKQALTEQTARRAVGYAEFSGTVLDSYWIPLAGSENLYLHFAQDISKWAKESLFPDGVKASLGCTGCSES